MNVRLLVPHISLDLPANIILAYNKMEETDPLVAIFRLHPLIGEEICKFGIFLDRYDTNKEVICSLVWSKKDKMVIYMITNGWPESISNLLELREVLWCLIMLQVLVARYCNKSCQMDHWRVYFFSFYSNENHRQHKKRCKEIQHFQKIIKS